MQHCDHILQAALLVTQDAQRRVIENGAVAVRQGLVAAVGTAEELALHWQASKNTNLGHMLIMPGLVNAHTHGAMTFLRGLADDLPLMQWLTEHIFPVEQHLSPETVEICAMLGHAEMLRTGSTACMDMYLIEDSVFRAALRTGIRCLGGEAIFTFPGAGGPGGSAMLDVVRQQAQTYQGNSRIKVLVCPHSVYTTTDSLLRQCADLAAELRLPLHLHLSETRTETEECLRLWGKRPIPYCRDLGLLRFGVSLAHVVDATEDDLDILAASKVSVVHNPSSNMKLASGTAPIAAMLQRHIKVALGTDGAASNNRLNMFTEMGRAALLHKLGTGDPTTLPAQCVLDMGTREGGAIFAGLDQDKAQCTPGILAPGHPADIIALDLNEPNMQPMYAAPSHLVYAATGMEVRMTMVEGEILYNNGVFSRFDYPALLEEVRSVRRWVIQKTRLA